MSEPRSEKVSAMLTPHLAAELEAYATHHRWSRSTAAAELIERGLRASGIARGRTPAGGYALTDAEVAEVLRASGEKES